MLEVAQDHWKWYNSIDRIYSTVTTALSCIVSENKTRYWLKIAIFRISFAFDAPGKGDPVGISPLVRKTSMAGRSEGKKFEDTFSRFIVIQCTNEM